jgi:hypothetical protein
LLKAAPEPLVFDLGQILIHRSFKFIRWERSGAGDRQLRTTQDIA